MRSILTMVLLCGAATAVTDGYAQQHFASGASKVPLIELYTSEGCSSCPPAERWLTGLKDDPRLWKTFVPIAFHVTYWDHLGWSDRFASRAYTERQYAYADSWRSGSVYTPCFVRDGREWRDREIPDVNAPGAGELALTFHDSRAVEVHFSPATGDPGTLEVWTALLISDVKSAVERGENAGHQLRHDFTVVELVHAPLTRQNGTSDFAATLHLEKKSSSPIGKLAIASWVTGGSTPGPVLQATGGWLSVASE